MRADRFPLAGDRLSPRVLRGVRLRAGGADPHPGRSRDGSARTRATAVTSTGSSRTGQPARHAAMRVCRSRPGASDPFAGRDGRPARKACATLNGTKWDVAGTLMAVWLWVAVIVAVAGLAWRTFAWLRAPVPLPMPLPPVPGDLAGSRAPAAPGGVSLRVPVPGEPVDLALRVGVPRGAPRRPRPPCMAVRRSGAGVGRSPARGGNLAERGAPRVARGACSGAASSLPASATSPSLPTT